MAKEQQEAAELLKAKLKTMSLDYELDRYEKRARELLAAAGYPLEWDELRTRLQTDKAAPRRVHHAETMLLRARLVREQVEKNEAKDAAWNAILMARAAMRADLPNYDKALVSEYQRSNAKKKQEAKDR